MKLLIRTPGISQFRYLPLLMILWYALHGQIHARRFELSPRLRSVFLAVRVADLVGKGRFLPGLGCQNEDPTVLMIALGLSFSINIIDERIV
jgi:hypothetical protein